MARKPRKPSKAGTKAAVARAIARSAGEDIPEPTIPIDPPIIPAAEIKKAKAKAKRARGRPTKYTPAVGRAICKMHAMGLSLRSIGQRPAMPKPTTIVGWSLDPEHPFFEQFTRAAFIKYTLMADDMVDISDNGTNDWMERETKSGRVAVVLNREAIERSRLRLDTRWKILAQALPKFAPRLNVEHTGKDGGAIQVENRPQPTGADHLSDIATRYQKGALKLIEAARKRRNGRFHAGRGSGREMTDEVE